MRALAIAATGMSAQQTQCRSHRQQHRKYQHDIVQAFARRIHRSVLSDRSHAGCSEPHRRSARYRKGPNLGLGVRSVADAKAAHPGLAGADGQPLRSCGERPRMVSDRSDPNGETLYTRAGSFNTNADRPARDGGRLYRGSDDHHSAGNGGGHRQPDRARCSPSWTTRSRPVRWASSILPTLPTRPASIRSEAISIGRHRRPALRSSASPAIPATERSISAIWRARTSIPSRKSPS